MNEKKTSNLPTVLVTGSTGFLGFRIVKALMGKDFKVRALVRKTSNLDKLKTLGVELCVGDISDLVSLKPAFKGVEYVVHAASDTVGSAESGMVNTIQGTKNVMALCKKYKIETLRQYQHRSRKQINEVRKNGGII